MTEQGPKYKPIFDRKQFEKGVELVQGYVNEAQTPSEKFRAYLLYAQLVGAAAMVSISALFDRILPGPPPPPDNGPRE